MRAKWAVGNEMLKLNSHGHFDRWVRIVFGKLKVFHCEALDVWHLSGDLHLREFSRNSGDLLLELLDVVVVDVRVAKSVDKVTWL